MNAALIGALTLVVAGHARAEDFRFADVSLTPAVTESLLRAGRALHPDDVARQIVESFPDLHLVVLDSNLSIDAPKLRWRDPRVASEIEQYYARSGWLSRTLEHYLPVGYVPFGDRPLMDHDVLLIRDYAARDVLLGGALKHAMAQAVAKVPGRLSFAELQMRSFDAIDNVQIGSADDRALAVDVLRMTIGIVRYSTLREVDVAEWLLNHRRELKLTPKQLRSLVDQANTRLIQATESLVKTSAAARELGADDVQQNVLRIRTQVTGVIGTLRAALCELDLG